MILELNPTADSLSGYRAMTHVDATPSQGYLLCSIERTGSTLLARALKGTDLAGRPREYFNPVEQARPWMREILGESTTVTGLRKILTAATTSNGWFGTKMHWGHLRYLGLSVEGCWTEERRTELYDLLRLRSPSPLPRAAALDLLWSQSVDGHSLTSAYGLLRSHLPDLRVIWLRRANMVARAVSFYRARRTGVWFRHMTAPAATAADVAEEMDLAEIHLLNCLGQFQEESWQRFFHEHALAPHCVTYGAGGGL